ncbi:hypothetical protein [Paenibacillus sp. Soil750]|uniref:hypothetical protein n=1 Tax=Paenibacillus sp. Soil750 TaxID=1736398 RepID=UPI0006F636F4|nr:hypothetical protein [Paenibacillus sp. Soil750]KRE56789.1 hypothetical protein ASL11_34100 [Paenibacillus sp. Soil750]
MKIRIRKRYIITGIVFFSFIILSFLWYERSKIDIDTLNKNLLIKDIKFGMSEEEVIQQWGPGEYINGMGGHGRAYNEKKVRISFSNDADNDLNGKVGSLEFSNPDYSIFSIRIGMDRLDAINHIKSNTKFKTVKYSEDIFVCGEFSIALRGKDLIEEIQIWFKDKDMTDRNY